MKLKRGIIPLIIFLLILVLVYAQTYLNESTQWEANLTAVDYGALAWGDIDDDGDLDLVITGSSFGGLIAKVYTNNGTSLIDNITWSSNLTQVQQGSISLGDIDNDGDLDLVLTGSGEHAKIYTNNGTSLTENISWEIELTGVYESSTAWADFNNDGKLDLVLAGRTSSGDIAKVYVNNGTSLNEDSGWGGNLTGVEESALTVGDVNNDGKIDLILSGEAGAGGPKFTSVYINNGSSLIENSVWGESFIAVNKGAFALGDYDNDGDLDLTYIGCCDRHLIYHNNGTTFVLNTTDIGTPDETLVGIFEGGVAWGDYDNDGDLDLISSGREGYTNVFVNNNTEFTHYQNDPEPQLMNVKYSALAWMDIDNDKDLDLILTGWVSNLEYIKVYINNITTNNSLPYSPGSFENYTTLDSKLFFGWGNGSDNETPSTGLYYNLKIGSSSGGNDIVSGIFGGSGGGGKSGGGANGYFGNMMQRRNITLNIPDRNYYWSVQTIDTSLAKGPWSTEHYYNTTPTYTIINFTNNYNLSTASITFNITAGDNTNISNVTLFGNWTGTFTANETNNSINNHYAYLFPKTLQDGRFLWKIQVCDVGANCVESENRTINIDTTAPTVNAQAPQNGTTIATSDVEATASFNDLNFVTCQAKIDTNNWQDMTTNQTTGLANYTFTGVTNAEHNITFNCTDTAKIQHSQTNTTTFTVNAAITDQTPPSLSITTPTSGSVVGSSTVSVSATFSDENNVNCEAKIDSNSWEDMIGDGATSGTATHTFTSVSNANHTIQVNCTDTSSTPNSNVSSVSFRVDTTKPLVLLMSPANGTSWTSSSTVTFTYNVSDILVQNCSLSIDGSIYQTDDTITINTSQTLTKTLSNGNYNWSVTCTDVINNVNTSETRFVTVSYSAPSVSGGGGGGGGAAAAAPTTVKNFTVDKKQIKVELMQGETKREQITIKNTGNTNLTFQISITGMEKYLHITDDKFVLKEGQTKTIEINFIAGSELKPETYKGSIKIKANNIEKTILIVMEVKEKEAQFDVKINIPEQFKQLFPGDELNANIQVINVGKIGKVDVLVTYFITDAAGNIIKKASDTVSVEDVVSFIRSLTVPKELPPGDYQFNVNITYKETSTHSQFPFEIKKEYPYLPNFLQKYWKEVAISSGVGIFVILIVVFVVLGIKRQIYAKEKEEIKKVKKKEEKLERKDKKLEKEVQALKREIKLKTTGVRILKKIGIAKSQEKPKKKKK